MREYNGKTFMISGWPRSGNVWLQHLIVNCIAGAKVEWCSRIAGVSHRLDSNLADNVENQYILTVRDPRDAVVSLYYLYSRGAIKKGWTFEGEPLSHFIRRSLLRGEEAAYLGMGWVEYMQQWLDIRDAGHPHVTSTSHEMLMRNREREIRRILSWGKAETAESTIRAAIEKSYKPKRPSYVPDRAWLGQGDKVPCGRIGEWKDHFNDECMEIVKEYCSDMMERLGYSWDE